MSHCRQPVELTTALRKAREEAIKAGDQAMAKRLAIEINATTSDLYPLHSLALTAAHNISQLRYYVDRAALEVRITPSVTGDWGDTLGQFLATLEEKLQIACDELSEAKGWAR